MASERKVGKTESLIMRHLSEIIRMEVKNSSVGIVNITACKITADLSIAKIYVSFLGAKNPQANLESLNESKGFIRSKLASRLTLRKVPNLEFILDETMENVDIIDNILKNITK